ncbi:MAG: ISAs1 family transposase [Pseudonocardiaceae bacterium]
MSACPSLPISAVVAPCGGSAAGADPVPGDLLAALAQVPDPRRGRGVRHRFLAILGIAVGAVLAGASTYTAIAEWAHDLPVGVRVRLGLRRRAPSESTIRRVLQAVDAEALDQVVSSWLAARSRPAVATPDARTLIAIDGKTSCGARGPDGRAVHLLAAFDHTSGVVLGQTVVEGKTNEITAFAPLCERLDLSGALVTADALHTQHRHADYLHTCGAHYLLTVKRNQPTLHHQLASLPWTQIPALDTTQGKGHGRVESRTLKLAALSEGIGFPHARLAIQLRRRRRPLTSRKWHTETVYAITDLGWSDTRAARLADAIRGHWGIENRLHWIRDVVFARTTPRSAPAPAPP